MKLIKSALVLGLVVSSAAMAQLSETESPLAKAYAAKNDGGFDHAGLVMARQQSSGPDAREVLARTGLGPRDVNLGYERDSGRGLDRGSFGSEREFRLDRGGFGSRMDPDFGSERGDHRRAPAYFVK